MGGNSTHKNKWDQMCGSSMHSLAVSKETRYGRQELIANKCWVKIYKTNIQHSYCAVSQRYGVISLVNSPPSTDNIAHALFCSSKRKLNQMGGNRTHKINGIECVAVVCIP